MATTTRKTSSKKTSSKKTTKTTAKTAAKGAVKNTPARKAAPSRASTGRAAKKATSREGAPGQGRAEEIFSNLKRDFGKARDVLAVEFDKAVEAARRRLPKGGIIDEEKLRSVGEDFKERMSSVGERLKDAGKRVSEASERLKVDEKARAVADASLTGLHGLASSLRGLAERLEESLEERRPYFTGEKADPGRYACRDCGEVMITAAAQTLPVCAGCGGKKFRHMA